jgi:hypothetical protein
MIHHPSHRIQAATLDRAKLVELADGLSEMRLLAEALIRLADECAKGTDAAIIATIAGTISRRATACEDLHEDISAPFAVAHSGCDPK